MVSDCVITFGIECNNSKNDDAFASGTDDTREPGLNTPHDEIPARHADGNISDAIDTLGVHDDAGSNHGVIDVTSSSSKRYGEFAEETPTRETMERACNENLEPMASAKKSKNPRKGLKKGEQVGNPTQPKDSHMQYRTERYEKYNWHSHQDLPMRAPRYAGSHAVYDDFKLLTGEPPAYFAIEETPCNSVRLDDRWVGLVGEHFNQTVMKKKWPSEFDNAGMLRAVRVPLGDPCLVWVTQGQLDIDGNSAPRDGCYYGWYRGLELLCGNEGLEQGLYWIRPSFEQPKCKGIAFKVSHPAPGEKKGCAPKSQVRQ